jgi:hypothetical protein
MIDCACGRKGEEGGGGGHACVLCAHFTSPTLMTISDTVFEMTKRRAPVAILQNIASTSLGFAPSARAIPTRNLSAEPPSVRLRKIGVPYLEEDAWECGGGQCTCHPRLVSL